MEREGPTLLAVNIADAPLSFPHSLPTSPKVSIRSPPLAVFPAIAVRFFAAPDC